MKLKITYEHDGGTFSPFWAKAMNADGIHVQCACGSSYQEAEERLMEKLSQPKPPPPPQPKEIEVPE